jgi:hypothetical protein
MCAEVTGGSSGPEEEPKPAPGNRNENAGLSSAIEAEVPISKNPTAIPNHFQSLFKLSSLPFPGVQVANGQETADPVCRDHFTCQKLEFYRDALPGDNVFIFTGRSGNREQVVFAGETTNGAISADAIHGDINRSLIWNHKDREDLKGMRSRFLLRGGLRPASLRAAHGKTHGDQIVRRQLQQRFPARRAQRGRSAQRCAPGEEARAHAQKILLATIFAVFVVFAVLVSHLWRQAMPGTDGFMNNPG